MLRAGRRRVRRPVHPVRPPAHRRLAHRHRRLLDEPLTDADADADDLVTSADYGASYDARPEHEPVGDDSATADGHNRATDPRTDNNGPHTPCCSADDVATPQPDDYYFDDPAAPTPRHTPPDPDTDTDAEQAADPCTDDKPAADPAVHRSPDRCSAHRSRGSRRCRCRLPLGQRLQ